MALDRLEALRQQMNTVDDAMFDLLKVRTKIAAHIGAYKKAHNMPIRDLKREAEHLKAIQQKYQGLDQDLVESILQAMIQDAVRIQQRVFITDAVAD